MRVQKKGTPVFPEAALDVTGSRLQPATIHPTSRSTPPHQGLQPSSHHRETPQTDMYQPARRPGFSTF